MSIVMDNCQTLEARQSEILSLSRLLAEFGVGFMDLVQSSRHADLSVFKGVGKLVSEHPRLYQFLQDNRALPINELLNLVNLQRRTIERHCKLIIAYAFLYSGHFPILRDYLAGST